MWLAFWANESVIPSALKSQFHVIGVAPVALPKNCTDCPPLGDSGFRVNDAVGTCEEVVLTLTLIHTVPELPTRMAVPLPLMNFQSSRYVPPLLGAVIGTMKV